MAQPHDGEQPGAPEAADSLRNTDTPSRGHAPNVSIQI